MATRCSGFCSSVNFPYKTRDRIEYKDGFLMCKICNKSIQTTDIRCACCETYLRTKARSARERQKRIVKRY